jgi:hypothetical protein
MGMLSVFLYVLNDPTLQTTSSDIDVLDMAAGYFGYLGFSTLSQDAVSFAKNITHWARAATTMRSQQQCITNDVTSPLHYINAEGLPC